MPFKSKKQMRWMYANEPDMAEEWAREGKTRRERTQSKRSKKRKARKK